MAVWAAGLAGLCGLAWPYTVDDAYIVARYARNLASGVGYSMNAAGPVTDGVTGPLWLIPGVAAEFAGVGSPVTAAKVVGLLCALAGGLLLLVRLRRRQSGRAAAVFAAACLLGQPTLATWAVAGLSAGLAGLLVVLAIPGPGNRASPLAPWSAAAMCWLRPELVPATVVLALLPSMLDRRTRRLPWGSLWPPLLGGLSVVAFRVYLFGDAWPLSVRAKPADLANGIDYLFRALLWTTSVIGLWPVLVAVRRGALREAVVAAAWITGLLSVALAGGDWMPGFRLVCPLLPLYGWLCGMGLARMQMGRAPTLPILLCACALSAPLVDGWLRVPQLSAVARSQQGPGASLARELASAGGTVALVDVGRLAFASGARVFDLGGVTDPRVGRLPGGHLDKRIPEALVRRVAPSLIVLHSRSLPQVDGQGRLRTLSGYPVERRVARMPWVRETFRVRRSVQYAPAYVYTVLERR